MASGAYTHTHIHSWTKVIIRNQACRPQAGTPGLKSFSEHGRFTLEELRLDDSLISSLVDRFKAAINAFRFFRFIGSIHKNLSITAKEMKGLRPLQHSVLADAIAGKQESIALKYVRLKNVRSFISRNQ